MQPTAVISPAARRLAAGRRARVEHALAIARTEDERRQLRRTAHRSHPLDVDRLDDIGAGHVGRLADRLGGAHLERGRLVLRAHQGERILVAEVARPDLGDPVGIRLLDRPFGKRRDEALQALREAPHDGVRERHRALEPRLAHELDRVVDDRVLGLIGECELVRAQPQRSLDRSTVELAHGTLAELLDAEVESAGALYGPVREGVARERGRARRALPPPPRRVRGSGVGLFRRHPG